MSKDDRQRLTATIERTYGWHIATTQMQAERAEVEKAGGVALRTLTRTISVKRNGRVTWNVVPLGRGAAHAIRDLAAATQLPRIRGLDERDLAPLADQVPKAITDARSLLGMRRFFTSREGKNAGSLAAEYLTQFEAWATNRGLDGLIYSLRPTENGVAALGTADSLSDVVGLRPHLKTLGRLDLIRATPIGPLRDAIAAIDNALKGEETYRKAAAQAGDTLRRAETDAMLATMHVDRLREATAERLVTKPLIDSGLTTVKEVKLAARRLETLPGIGEASARRIRGAAVTIEQTTFDEMPVRIDIKKRTREATAFLKALGAWDAARTLRNATSDLERAGELRDLVAAVDGGTTHLIVASGTALDTAELLVGVNAVVARGTALAAGRPGGGAVPEDPWDDFLARPADYYGMLQELGFLTEDEGKAHGDLPEEIVEAVRALALNAEHLTVGTLRGYQSFGARFALVQRKVIIGDEMGLGKTVEAIAVLAHLRGAHGYNHFVVVCPAAVVTNWIREIHSKSKLRAHRIHGKSREQSARSWIRFGGVAVTTFETLNWFQQHHPAVGHVGAVIVDEAHYIKNPNAQRSRNTAALLNRSDRAVLLTGTPLENRLDEFAALVKYVQPSLVVSTNGLSPRTFRKQVAPAYLRRNQEDVLQELPELVEVDEVMPMSSADSAAYRAAVQAGNFMAMRQAAMIHGQQSMKVERLRSIVDEAEANGRRVIVFSHFREVLDQVARALPGRVFGPLTGSVAAVARQRMVDDFSKASYGAVLVSQIVAGGVGLNIQAASVIVICEPQLKPTTEWQAIARAHRMGQLDTVQVHRLLSEEGVDQRVTEILASKKTLFDDFARVSATAHSAEEAFDITEAELAREVVEAERERLFAS
ncbi:DEAD/DEAH box helicase [Cellulosimicrobium sp. NPDC055967]|uniref:DEAD/DEAH box helicase n=1 Tax=Cellulosimicrobium sp. NPDC055967 TaxID=3345670 RepID=UPI0035D6E528